MTDLQKTGGDDHKQYGLQHTKDEKDGSNKASLITREELEGTPFTVITNKELAKEDSFLVLGNVRVTEIKSKRELLKMVKDRDWLLISSTIMAIANLLTEKNK